MKRVASTPDRRTLRIGELAATSGLTVDAVRYYERQGLLPRAPRTPGGFRQYTVSSLDRLRFIKQAQAHGLTLREIRDLLGTEQRAGRDRCRRVRDLLAERLVGLDVKRRELEAFCRTLREYLRMCDRALARSGDPECPVVEDLGREARRRRAG